MDLAQLSLYRMLCLPDVPPSLLQTQARLTMPLLESTVLQGTPLRKPTETDSFISPNGKLRLPRIRPQLSLPEETVEDEQNVSLMIRTLAAGERVESLGLGARGRRLRLRKARGSCPRDVEPGEFSLSIAPLMRRSAELIPSDSKDQLPHVSVPPPVNRALQDQVIGRQVELLNSSEVQLAQKAAVKSHHRYRTQPDPSTLRPAYKPRARLKAIDFKPTPQQLQAVYSCLNEELSSLVVDSCGSVPRQGESCYKCYVGPGNNSQLVVHLVKKRWFWTRVDDWETADFIWTQNKQQSVLDTFPCASPAEFLTPKQSKSYHLPLISRPIRLLADSERKKSGLPLISDSPAYVSFEAIPQSTPIRLYNRLERNYQLTSKKRLYYNMMAYCQSREIDVFTMIPLTFHIENGKKDEAFARFVDSYQAVAAEAEKRKSYNLWIIKPGEATNCGHGIHVSSDLEEIKRLVGEKFSSTGRKRTYIIQKYIEHPLLIHKRKFDIRCYGLVTSFHSHLQGYFYHDGYLRTSSKEFSLKNSNKFVHLTNDAVQKKSEDYGKFEHGNKMSYGDFQKYLDEHSPRQVDFMTEIWPQIKQLVTSTFEATFHGLDPLSRQHSFEILGYDFMIDEDFKVWLIEVNTNPCLALSSAYLARIIPSMLENALRIVLDPHFPEPEGKRHSQEWIYQPLTNKFELVFSSYLFSQKSPLGSSQAVLSGSSSEDTHSEDGN